jgi:hypothetical protein
VLDLAVERAKARDRLITMGKNERRNVMNTLGNRPKPNQMMKRGANAIFGTSWVKTRTGITTRSTAREKATAMPQGTLTRTARRKPSAISPSVVRACCARRARAESSPGGERRRQDVPRDFVRRAARRSG